MVTLCSVSSTVATSALGLLILAVLSVRGQSISASASNVTVAYLQEAQLTCTLSGYGGTDTVTVSIEKNSGPLSASMSSQQGLTGSLTLLSSNYSDSGQFTCTITVMRDGGNDVYTAAFYLLVEERLVFLEEPGDSNDTPLDVTRRFLCHPNLGQVSRWLKNGVELQFDDRVTQFDLGITISRVMYSDLGEYTCVVEYTGTMEEASAILTVEGYVAPFGQFGFGLIKSSETPVVECSLGGTPGAVEFYWQKGESVNASRVTMLTTVPSGPFVDSLGRLDLTRAVPNDSDIYRCTGTDVVGNSGFQLYNVEVITVDTSLVLATQWYFILLYVIAGVALLSILALLVWCCYSTRHHWCVKGTKTVKYKKRVRRSKGQRKVPMKDVEANRYGY